jgi:hypothetical protein
VFSWRYEQNVVTLVILAAVYPLLAPISWLMSTLLTMVTTVTLVTMVTEFIHADRQIWPVLYAFFSCTWYKERITTGKRFNDSVSVVVYVV